MVVGDDDADHRVGTSSSTRVPDALARGRSRGCRRTGATSSSTSDRPRWPSASRSLAYPGPNPRPSSDDDEPRDAVVDRQLDAHRARIGVRDDVPHGFLRDPVDERLSLAVQPLGALDRDDDDRRRSPRSGLTRSRDRGLEARGREVRRMQLDEQRAQVANGAAKALDRPAQHALPRRSRRARLPASASGASEKARPAMSCTGPSCRYEATRRRSRADAAIAFASSASRSSFPRCSRRVSDQTSGTWIEQDQRDRAEDRRRERRSRRRALAVTEPKRW